MKLITQSHPGIRPVGNDLSGSLQGAGGVGGLLARVSTSGALYYHYDANGNPARLTNLGTNGGKYRYDAFGNVREAAGVLVADNPWQFSTKYFDQETGFSYYGFRYYDPVTGRWPSRDPIEEDGGLNLYAMVDNDPMNKTDYLGLLFDSCSTVGATRIDDTEIEVTNTTDAAAPWADKIFKKIFKRLLIASTNYTWGVIVEVEYSVCEETCILGVSIKRWKEQPDIERTDPGPYFEYDEAYDSGSNILDDIIADIIFN